MLRTGSGRGGGGGGQGGQVEEGDGRLGAEGRDEGEQGGELSCQREGEWGGGHGKGTVGGEDAEAAEGLAKLVMGLTSEDVDRLLQVGCVCVCVVACVCVCVLLCVFAIVCVCVCMCVCMACCSCIWFCVSCPYDSVVKGKRVGI